MGWLIFTILALILIAILWIVGSKARNQSNRLRIIREERDKSGSYPSTSSDEEDFTYFVWASSRIICSLLVLGILIYSLVASIHKVDAGHVGVVYEFGAIVDQTEDGLVFTPPWRNLKSANVQEQSHTFADDNGNGRFGLTAGSLETQDVYMVVSLNYRVSPRAVQQLYREVGVDYFQRLVVPRINQIIKDEVVQYPAVQVTQKRDEIRAAVEERLRLELQPYSIEVVALQVVNIDYSEEFNNSIEAKQVATQDALREQERVRQAQAEAQQAIERAKGDAQANIERAKGDSQAAIERANGQAEANATLNASLTPAIIQYEAVRNLSDNIQIALIPSGQGLIIDPSTILQGSTPE